MVFLIIKIGGSLIGQGKEIVRGLVSLSKSGYSFLVIPGGGPMADLVRDLYTRYGLGQEAAHWMAVLAMEQYAYLLSDETGSSLTAKIEFVDCGVRVLLPYTAFKDREIGVEHTWDYTSDAIAAAISCILGQDFIKATDVDAIFLNGLPVRDISADRLFGVDTCIDQGALRILQAYKRSCKVINASRPDEFLSMIINGAGGTVIRG